MEASELQTALAKLEMESIIQRAILDALMQQADTSMLNIQIPIIRNSAKKTVEAKYPLAKLD